MLRIQTSAATLLLILPLVCLAQTTGTTTGTTSQSTTTTARTTSSGNITRPIYLSGKVRLADGQNPPDRILIERVCNGIARPEGYTDSRGDFGFQIGSQVSATFPDASVGFEKLSPALQDSISPPAGLSDTNLASCELRANVPGYMSDSISLGFRRAMDNPFVGVIYLHPLSRPQTLSFSATSASAPQNAINAFQKGLESRDRKQWAEAEKQFAKAVREYPRYALAWFEMGRLFQEEKKPEDAALAFNKAIEADPRFLSPYSELASISATAGKWPDVVRYTSQMFKLDPSVGSEFYFYSAVANHYVGNGMVAEEHAREAARRDPKHQNPKINHVLGVILSAKGAYKEAAENLRLYLELMPSASDAAVVRNHLAEIEKK